jgi:DNA polymerase I-like protein with 3'-5' exonuclease and polymerase domains
MIYRIVVVGSFFFLLEIEIKPCFFLFSKGAKSLSEIVNVSEKEASDFISSFLASFPGIKEWMQNILKQAKKEKRVRTLTNRYRLLPDIDSFDSKARRRSERQVRENSFQTIFFFS